MPGTAAEQTAAEMDALRGELAEEHKTGVAWLDLNAPPTRLGDALRHLHDWIHDRPHDACGVSHRTRASSHPTRVGRSPDLRAPDSGRGAAVRAGRVDGVRSGRCVSGVGSMRVQGRPVACFSHLSD